jgi:hypothetical protein
VKKKALKAVALAATAFLILTAEGCPPEGSQAKRATTPVITRSGDYKITNNFHPNIQAPKPTKDCEWWILYDIPGGTAGADAVQLKHVTTTVKTSVNLGREYTFNYPSPKNGTKVTVIGRGTTFVTKGCGPWYKK